MSQSLFSGVDAVRHRTRQSGRGTSGPGTDARARARAFAAPVPGAARRRTSRLARSLAAIFVAAAGTIGPLGSPAVALAATPDLTVVTTASYDARPDFGRIDVTVDITATNHLVDTATRHFTYQQAFLAVQPGAREFTVSSKSGFPTVAVSETKPSYTLLKLAFGTALAAGRSTRLTLTYTLKDQGTTPDRELRVGSTLTTFPAWALASTGTAGSKVVVTVPAGYTVTFPRGSIPGPTTAPDGRQVWTSDPVDDPLKFDLLVRAQRPPLLVDSQVSVPVRGGSAQLTLRAWSDDPGWATRMAAMYKDGIPGLEAAIGLAWPRTTPLKVEEVLDPPAGGIAGSFDPTLDRIQVIYSAGAEVALHEAAHAWFNGGLVADRWANEGFASYYAEVVAAKLGLPFKPAAVTAELRGAEVPLNAWASGDAQPPEGADLSAVEAYGYAASALLAQRIADRVGADGLRHLWATIDAGLAPYQPPRGPTEYLAGPPDWRSLLDLIERDGSATAGDLWAGLVVKPDEAATLAERGAARHAYVDVLGRAGGWSLPKAIREALRTWQFSTARDQLAIAAKVLDGRDTLANRVAAVGATLPSGLEQRFEQATDLTPVQAEVEADLQAVAAISAAQTARPSALGPVEWIGLIGSSPDRQLRDGVAALAGGDPAAAAAAGSSAEAAWRDAGRAGQIRITLLAGLAVIVIVAFALIRGRRGVADA